MPCRSPQPTRSSRSVTSPAKRCERPARRCERPAKRCERPAKRCERLAKRCERLAKRCERLALARVRYTAARPGQGELDARRVALLEDALETWQEIPFGGEAGLEAFFEESWALYVLDESPRALGHIHGLLAPQLRERPHPEALVLRATIYFEHCRFEAARHTVDDFHARFDPLLAELEQLEDSLAETDMAYAWLESVRSGRSPLRGEAGEVVRAALDDRELARLVVSVRAIEAEGERLAHAPSEIREGSLGMRIAQELALARSDLCVRRGAGAPAALMSSSCRPMSSCLEGPAPRSVGR